MKHIIRCCFVSLILTMFACSQAQAAPTAEVAKGLAWLQGQVQGDGSLTGEAASVATPYQARNETLHILKLLASAPTPLLDAITADTEDSVEYLSRRIVAISLTGGSTSSLVAQLNALQNPDGGFGGGAAYTSHALDTAWALTAYAKAGLAHSSAALNARNYLASIVEMDGGMSGSTEVERVANSAMSASALQIVPASAGSLTAINQLVAWLLQKQAVDGSWNQDISLTALALMAVNSIATDPTLHATAQAYLLRQQGSDGSWSADPFVTAVALRALSAERGSAPALLGSVIGIVLDQASGTPLQGATLMLAGAGNATAQSAQDGRFKLDNLQGGAYTLQVQKPGYTTYDKTLSLTAGQTLDLGNIALSQSVTAGIVRGRVTVAATGLPLASAKVSLTGAASLNAVTDSNGQFEFTNVPPGVISASATAPSYVSASGSATLAAGQTILFSPALYAVGDPSPPTTGSFVGKVVAAGSLTPLPGATIQLNGVPRGTTSADGTFNLTLSPGSYAVSIGLTGYDSATASFVLTAGSTVSAGVVSLNKQLSSSSIHGLVVDQASGGGIAGAQVQIIGGTTVMTGADGSYSLNNLQGTRFDIRVSATGFTSQSWQVQLSRTSDVVQDFSLSAQSSGSLDIGMLTIAPSVVPSRSDVMVAATVGNNGSAPISGVLAMQVLDSRGVVVSNGIAYGSTGSTLLGVFTLEPGASLPIVIKWNSGQFAPGGYTLVARVSEAGTVSAGTPLGTVLSTRQGSLSITGDQHFIGSITADPPVLRAGTSTPVRLSAVLQNDGNVEMPAQDYQLQIINDATGAVSATQTVPGVAFVPSALQSLQFADWTPAAGGNYRVEIQAAQGSGLGKISQTVYVGDSATALFTVSKPVVPPGTQTVKGSVRVSGQDVTGVISDPLAPLIKTAIQKGVTYNDAMAANRSVGDRCLACHIEAQALVSGETTRRFTTYNRYERNILSNALTLNQQVIGYFDTNFPQHQQTETMLGMWALNSFQNKTDFIHSMVRAVNYLIGNQQADGRWVNDHATGEAWWQPAATQTAMNLKNLADFAKQISQMPADAVGTWTSRSWLVGSAVTTPQSSAVAGSGNIYVSNANGTVWLIRPDGSSISLLSGLSNPRGIVVTSDETVYVGTSSGVMKRAPDGTVSTLASTSAYGIAVGPDMNFYLSDPAANKIIQVTPQGVATDYLVGGALNAPAGIAFSPEGDLIVVNTGSRRILRFRPDKSYEVVVEWMSGPPYNVVDTGKGWLVTSDTGAYLFNRDWQGQRLTFSGTRSAAALADGSLLVDNGSDTLLKLSFSPASIPALTTAVDNAISLATNYLLQDSTTDTSSNMDVAFRLIGLGNASQHFQGTTLGDAALAKTKSLDTLLRSRQLPDGGWGRMTYNDSDSMVTAQVGYALDYLSPSATDPVIRKAIQLLLSRQTADGSWRSENGVFRATSQYIGATTWVVIWLPIALDRLGGIDTDLTLTMPVNISLTNPSITPTSITPGVEGTTSYFWKLQGVTTAGKGIDFDLTLTDLQVNESRKAASDAYLTFNNTFTQTPVTSPISIPVVTASAFLDLTVTTDGQNYPALSPISISSLVNNTGLTSNNGSVGLSIYSAADGVLVADLGSYPFGTLAAGAQIALPAQWNTGTTAPGPYYVLGILFDSQGNKAGTSKAAFNIVGAGSGPDVSAKVVTDKQIYQPYDTVRVLDRINNLTQNQAIAGMSAVTTVSKPDGTVLWRKGESLTQLVAGAHHDLNYTVSLSNAVSGAYKATLTVLNGAGAQTAYSETFFTVDTSSNSGNGLTGTIFADPKLVPIGDAALLSSSAVNLGNAELANVVLKTTVVDPLTQTVVAEWPETVTLKQQQPYRVSRSWTTKGSVGQTYVAVLTAVVAGKSLTLAQASFTLTEAPMKFAVVQSRLAESRVLVLAACSGSSSGGDDEHDEHDKYDDEHDEDKHGDVSGSAACASKRVLAIQTYLAARDIKRLVTADENVFRKAMRSGYYNIHWLSGGNTELTNDIEEELAEAVYRGDSLILDNLSGARAAYVDRVAGTHYHGTLSPSSLNVTTNNVLFPTLTRPTSGVPAYLKLTSGQVQAKFATPIRYSQSLSCSETHPSTSGSYPAIVTNQFGAGRAITYGFDIVASLQSGADWSTIFDSALRYLNPPIIATLTGGAYVPFLTTVTNQAKPVDLEIVLNPHVGGYIQDTLPAATIDEVGRPVWRFTLSEGSKIDLLTGLRLPLANGVANLATTVSTIHNNQTSPFGKYTTSFTVKDANTRITSLISGLKALAISNTNDKSYRNSAVNYLNLAAPLLNGSPTQLNAAINYLIDATRYLAKITALDMGVYRTEADLVLQETQYKWFKLQS